MFRFFLNKAERLQADTQILPLSLIIVLARELLWSMMEPKYRLCWRMINLVN